MLTSGVCPRIVPSLAPSHPLGLTCMGPLWPCLLFCPSSVVFNGTGGQHYHSYTNVLNGAGEINSVEVLIVYSTLFPLILRQSCMVTICQLLDHPI